ncbi:MAG: AMP-binding protein [Rubellimicrobium sp.]|nr:AMP-binding protein [Rubellimicrobium sp.]
MTTPGPRFDGPELARTPANHVALSPLSLLRRTALVHPDRPAVIHGDLRRTWREVDLRCRRLASALTARGIGRGDVVAVLLPNGPEALECALAIPMTGAVLNALNTRLDPESLGHILAHGGARVLIADAALVPLAREAMARAGSAPLIVTTGPASAGDDLTSDALTWDGLIAAGRDDFLPALPDDEWEPLSLNYTSGTTGLPKGAVYSHRGACLNAVNNAITWEMGHFPVYLWTLPLFHCNGWCFPWTVTMLAGTHVFLPGATEGAAILDAIRRHGVTHLCGAPVIMAMLADAASAQPQRLVRRVAFMTAAAPPPAPVIAALESCGFDITHVYGLTEVYGPAVVCAIPPGWQDRPADERARLKARQGVAYELEEEVSVLDPATGTPVPHDGQTQGEVVFRGNICMMGYLGDAEGTARAFRDGWFWSGDIAVRHADGYIEICDRAKDIIISGGENISSIRIEKAICDHPAVAQAAVVARPDARWGEVPCAFVEIRPGCTLTQAALAEHCRARLAGFMMPKAFVFGTLPVTGTGKIQKHRLREGARADPPAFLPDGAMP